MKVFDKKQLNKGKGKIRFLKIIYVKLVYVKDIPYIYI